MHLAEQADEQSQPRNRLYPTVQRLPCGHGESRGPVS